MPAIGKVLIQGQVNALGVDVMAAYNAVTRVDDFACIPEQSVAQGITTYIAQNRGARRYDRIRAGFRAGLLMEFCYWILIGSITALFRTPIVSLFVSGEGAEQVTALGSQYLAAMAVFYILPAFTNGFQGITGAWAAWASPWREPLSRPPAGGVYHAAGAPCGHLRHLLCLCGRLDRHAVVRDSPLFPAYAGTRGGTGSLSRI